MNDPKPAQYIDVLGIDTRLRYLTPAERIREYRQAVAPYEKQLAMIYAHSVRPLQVRYTGELNAEGFPAFDLMCVGPLPEWAQQAEAVLTEAILQIRKLYLTGL